LQVCLVGEGPFLWLFSFDSRCALAPSGPAAPFGRALRATCAQKESNPAAQRTEALLFVIDWSLMRHEPNRVHASLRQFDFAVIRFLLRHNPPDNAGRVAHDSRRGLT
jgi:hypothetical protein